VGGGRAGYDITGIAVAEANSIHDYEYDGPLGTGIGFELF
jgi:hypothetical protein